MILRTEDDVQKLLLDKCREKYKMHALPNSWQERGNNSHIYKMMSEFLDLPQPELEDIICRNKLIAYAQVLGWDGVLKEGKIKTEKIKQAISSTTTVQRELLDLKDATQISKWLAPIFLLYEIYFLILLYCELSQDSVLVFIEQEKENSKIELTEEQCAQLSRTIISDFHTIYLREACVIVNAYLVKKQVSSLVDHLQDKLTEEDDKALMEFAEAYYNTIKSCELEFCFASGSLGHAIYLSLYCHKQGDSEFLHIRVDNSADRESTCFKVETTPQGKQYILSYFKDVCLALKKDDRTARDILYMKNKYKKDKDLSIKSEFDPLEPQTGPNCVVEGFRRRRYHRFQVYKAYVGLYEWFKQEEEFFVNRKKDSLRPKDTFEAQFGLSNDAHTGNVTKNDNHNKNRDNFDALFRRQFCWFNVWSNEKSSVPADIHVEFDSVLQPLNSEYISRSNLFVEDYEQINQFLLSDNEGVQESILIIRSKSQSQSIEFCRSMSKEFLSKDRKIIVLDAMNSLKMLINELESMLGYLIGEPFKRQKFNDFKHCKSLIEALIKLKHHSEEDALQWVFLILRFPGSLDELLEITRINKKQVRFIINDPGWPMSKNNEKMKDVAELQLSEVDESKLTLTSLNVQSIFASFALREQAFLSLFAFMGESAIPDILFPLITGNDESLGMSKKGFLSQVSKIWVYKDPIIFYEYHQDLKNQVREWVTSKQIISGIDNLIERIAVHLEIDLNRDNRPNEYCQAMSHCLGSLLDNLDQNSIRYGTECRSTLIRLNQLCLFVFKHAGEITKFINVQKIMEKYLEDVPSEVFCALTDLQFLSYFYRDDLAKSKITTSFETIREFYNKHKVDDFNFSNQQRYSLYQIIDEASRACSSSQAIMSIHSEFDHAKIANYILKVENMSQDITPDNVEHYAIALYELIKIKFYLIYQDSLLTRSSNSRDDEMLTKRFQQTIIAIEKANDFLVGKKIKSYSSVRLYFDTLHAVCLRELSQCCTGFDRVRYLKNADEKYTIIFNKSLGMFGKYNKFTAVLLDNFALLRCLQGRVNEAYHCASDALEIHGEILGESEFASDERVALAKLLLFKARNLCFDNNKNTLGLISKHSEAILECFLENEDDPDLPRQPKQKIHKTWQLMFKLEYSHYWAKKVALDFVGDSNDILSILTYLARITQFDQDTIVHLLMDKAIALNNYPFTKALLDWDKECKSKQYNTLVFERYSQPEKLLLLYRDKNNFTYLHKAANYNHPKIVELLLYCMKNVLIPNNWRLVNYNNPVEDNKAKYLINAQSKAGYTALHIATYMGYMQITGLLCAESNILLSKNSSNYTALDYAEDCHFTDIKRLLESTKKIVTESGKKLTHNTTSQHKTQKHEKIRHETQIVQCLEGDTSDSDLPVILWACLYYHHEDDAIKIIDEFVKPQSFEKVYLQKYTFQDNSPPKSLLEYIATNNHYQVLQHILSGYAANRENHSISLEVWRKYLTGHWSLIHRAGASLSGECLILLTDFSIKILKIVDVFSVTHQADWTILHEAVTSLVENREGTVRFLVDAYPESLLVQEANGQTALMLSVKAKNYDFVDVLIDKSDGADLYLSNVDEVTAHTYITILKPMLRHSRFNFDRTFKESVGVSLYQYALFDQPAVTNLQNARASQKYFSDLILSDEFLQHDHQCYIPRRIKVTRTNPNHDFSSYEYKIMDEYILELLEFRDNEHEYEPWFFYQQGLSGNGKTSLLERLSVKLYCQGVPVCHATISKDKVSIYGREILEHHVRCENDVLYINNMFVSKARDFLAKHDVKFQPQKKLVILIDCQEKYNVLYESGVGDNKFLIKILVAGSKELSIINGKKSRKESGCFSPTVYTYLKIQPFTQSEIVSYLWERYSKNELISNFDKSLNIYAKLKKIILKNRNLIELFSSPLVLSLLCDCCDINSEKTDDFIEKIKRYSLDSDAVEYLIFELLQNTPNAKISHAKVRSFELAYKLRKTFDGGEAVFMTELAVMLDSTSIRFFSIYLSYFCEDRKTLINSLQSKLASPDIDKIVFSNIIRILNFIGDTVQFDGIIGTHTFTPDQIERGSFYRLNTGIHYLPELPHNAQFIEPIINQNSTDNGLSPLVVIDKFSRLNQRQKIKQILYVDNDLFVYKNDGDYLCKTILLDPNNRDDISLSKLPDGKAICRKVTIIDKDYLFIVHARSLVYFELSDATMRFHKIKKCYHKRAKFFQVVMPLSLIIIIDTEGDIYIGHFESPSSIRKPEKVSFKLSSINNRNQNLNKIQNILDLTNYALVNENECNISLFIFFEGVVRLISFKISSKNDRFQISHDEIVTDLLSINAYVTSSALQRSSAENGKKIVYVKGNYSLGAFDLPQLSSLNLPIYFNNDKILGIFVTSNNDLLVYGSSNRIHIFKPENNLKHYSTIYVDLPMVTDILEISSEPRNMLLLSCDDTHSLLPLPTSSEHNHENIILDEYNASTLFRNRENEPCVVIATRTKIFKLNLIKKSRNEYLRTSNSLILYLRHFILTNHDYLFIIDVTGAISYFNLITNSYIENIHQFVCPGRPFSLTKRSNNEFSFMTIKADAQSNVIYERFITKVHSIDNITTNRDHQFDTTHIIEGQELIGISSDNSFDYPQVHGSEKKVFTDYITKRAFVLQYEAVQICVDGRNAVALDTQFNIYLINLEEDLFHLKKITPVLKIQNAIPKININQVKHMIFHSTSKSLSWSINNTIYYVSLTQSPFNIVKVGEHSKITRLYWVKLDGGDDLISLVSINRFSHIMHWKQNEKKLASWFPIYTSYPTFSYIPEDMIDSSSGLKVASVSLDKRYFSLLLNENENIQDYLSGAKNKELMYYAMYHPACFQREYTTFTSYYAALDSLSDEVANKFGMAHFRHQQIYALLEANPQVKAYIITTFYDTSVVCDMATKESFNVIIFSATDLKQYLHMKNYTFDKLLTYETCFRYNFQQENQVLSNLFMSSDDNSNYPSVPDELYDSIAIHNQVLFPKSIVKQFNDDRAMAQKICKISGIEYLFVVKDSERTLLQGIFNMFSPRKKATLTLNTFNSLVDKSDHSKYVECLVAYFCYLIAKAKLDSGVTNKMTNYVFSHISYLRSSFDPQVLITIIKHKLPEVINLDTSDCAQLFVECNYFNNKLTDFDHTWLNTVTTLASTMIRNSHIDTRLEKSVLLYIICRELSSRGMANEALVILLRHTNIDSVEKTSCIQYLFRLSLSYIFKQLHQLTLALHFIKLNETLLEEFLDSDEFARAVVPHVSLTYLKLDIYDLILSVFNYNIDRTAHTLPRDEITPSPLVYTCYNYIKKNCDLMKNSNPHKYVYYLSHVCNFYMIFYFSGKTIRLSNTIVLPTTLHKRLVENYNYIMLTVLNPRNLYTRESLTAVISYIYFLIYLNRYLEAKDIIQFIETKIPAQKSAGILKIECASLIFLTSTLDILTSSNHDNRYQLLLIVLRDYINTMSPLVSNNQKLLKPLEKINSNMPVLEDDSLNVDNLFKVEWCIIQIFDFTALLLKNVAGAKHPFLLKIKEIHNTLKYCNDWNGFVEYQRISANEKVLSTELKPYTVVNVPHKHSNPQLTDFAVSQDNLPSVSSSHKNKNTMGKFSVRLNLFKVEQPKEKTFLEFYCNPNSNNIRIKKQPKNSASKKMLVNIGGKWELNYDQCTSRESITIVLTLISLAHCNYIEIAHLMPSESESFSNQLCFKIRNAMNNGKSLVAVYSELAMTEKINKMHYVLIVYHQNKIYIVDPRGRLDPSIIKEFNLLTNNLRLDEMSVFVSTSCIHRDFETNTPSSSGVICLALSEFFVKSFYLGQLHKMALENRSDHSHFFPESQSTIRYSTFMLSEVSPKLVPPGDGQYQQAIEACYHKFYSLVDRLNVKEVKAIEDLMGIKITLETRDSNQQSKLKVSHPRHIQNTRLRDSAGKSVSAPASAFKGFNLSLLGSRTHTSSTYQSNNIDLYKRLYHTIDEGWDPKEMAEAINASLQDDNLKIIQENLRLNVVKFGFLIKEIARDGNCFFTCVSDQLQSNFYPNYSRFSSDYLRQCVTKHLIDHIDLYREATENIEQYITRISKPRKWADFLAISAMTRILDVTIVLVRSDGHDPVVFRRADPLATLYLGYEVGLHFQSLVRTKDQSEKIINDVIGKADIDDFNIKFEFPEDISSPVTGMSPKSPAPAGFPRSSFGSLRGRKSASYGQILNQKLVESNMASLLTSGPPANSAAIHFSGVKNGMNELRFEQWLSRDSVSILLPLIVSKSQAVMTFCALDGGQGIAAYSSQIVSAIRIARSNKKSLFIISKEPVNFQSQHYVLTIFHHDKLFFIDPTGQLRNAFCMEFINLKQYYDLVNVPVFASKFKLQNDPEGKLVSCGVICLALCEFFANSKNLNKLNAFNADKEDQLFLKEGRYNFLYHIFDLERLLDNSYRIHAFDQYKTSIIDYRSFLYEQLNALSEDEILILKEADYKILALIQQSDLSKDEQKQQLQDPQDSDSSSDLESRWDQSGLHL